MTERIFDENRMIEIEISDGDSYSLSQLTFDVLEDLLKKRNEYLDAQKVDSVEDCIQRAQDFKNGTGVYSEDSDDEDVDLSKRTVTIQEHTFSKPWEQETTPSFRRDVNYEVLKLVNFIDELDNEIIHDAQSVCKIVTKLLDYYTGLEGDPFIQELLENNLSYEGDNYSLEYEGRTPLSFACDVAKILLTLEEIKQDLDRLPL